MAGILAINALVFGVAIVALHAAGLRRTLVIVAVANTITGFRAA